MVKRTVYWVSPHSGNWKVQREGSDKPANVYPTKAEAIERGMELAKNNRPSQLMIQRADGTIEDERTYDSDPYPPKG